jgi:hypothetical protein
MAGLINAPRFSPALAALMVILTIGLTVAVMNYLGGSDDSPDQIAVKTQPESKAGGSEPTEPASDTAAAEGSGEDGQDLVSAPGGKGSDTGITVEPSRRKPAVKRPMVQEYSPEQLIREAEERYQTAIGLLTRDVRNRQTKLSEEELLRFENTLAAIDRAIAETRQAVRTNPEDPVALQYLLAAYSKKVDVLREMARD